jgi:aspartyl-tRNA(Asn)/glutamyl-tRNA(Gln) amidotransferase subunit A
MSTGPGDAAIERWSVAALAEAVRTGSLSAAGLLGLCRKRVEESNDTLRAFVYLDWAQAEAAAAAVDRDVARGTPLGSLAGIPFGVKDTEDCAGMPTEWGSLLRRGAPAAKADDPHVARLRAAGAIPVGKTATAEFMSGLLTESKATGVTRNPWNPAMTPGGSSGGSAAAVASGMVPFATGSDGGGSLRIPASFCGLVGFKTSLGAVPLVDRDASMTNCEGVLTCDVIDTARLIDIMSGPLACDPVSYAGPPPGLEAAIPRVRLDGLRVAYEPLLGGAGAAPDVALACQSAFSRLIATEHVADVSGTMEFGVDCDEVNDVFVGAGAANVWSLVDQDDLRDPELMSDYFRERLERSAEVSIQEYGRYFGRRQRLRTRWTEWFRHVDAILLPTLSTCDVTAAGPPPARVPGQRFEGGGAAAPLTRIANLMGTPSVSVPVGIADNGVPIGIQVMTAFHRDDLALRLGIALQTHVGPKLLGP